MLRAGKGLDERLCEVRVTFKRQAYNGLVGGNCNELVMRIQPDEAIYLKTMNKMPGWQKDRAVPVVLDMTYSKSFPGLPMSEAASPCIGGREKLAFRPRRVARTRVNTILPCPSSPGQVRSLRPPESRFLAAVPTLFTPHPRSQTALGRTSPSKKPKEYGHCRPSFCGLREGLFDRCRAALLDLAQHGPILGDAHPDRAIWGHFDVCRVPPRAAER